MISTRSNWLRWREENSLTFGLVTLGGPMVTSRGSMGSWRTFKADETKPVEAQVSGQPHYTLRC